MRKNPKATCKQYGRHLSRLRSITLPILLNAYYQSTGEWPRFEACVSDISEHIRTINRSWQLTFGSSATATITVDSRPLFFRFQELFSLSDGGRTAGAVAGQKDFARQTHFLCSNFVKLSETVILESWTRNSGACSLDEAIAHRCCNSPHTLDSMGLERSYNERKKRRKNLHIPFSNVATTSWILMTWRTMSWGGQCASTDTVVPPLEWVRDSRIGYANCVAVRQIKFLHRL